MSKKNKLFISCEEASSNCDKSQYDEATFWERLKLNIHLLYCQACQKRSRNNNKLSAVIKESSVNCLDIKNKKEMKDCFEKELKKQHN